MFHTVGDCGPAREGRSSGVTGVCSPRVTATYKMERGGKQNAGSNAGPCRVLGLPILQETENCGGAVSKGGKQSSFWLRKTIVAGQTKI